MAVLAKVLSTAIGVDVDGEALETILIFTGAGLLISVAAMIYGLDLGPGLP
ncbi:MULTISPECIES: hypothetical protein [unclassified Bradyrhizobium]|uniref:hypothetical protein n=1 Tax=unclassified Bradyrhizobium TaxID=2631580 RepID=UPI001FF76BDD|nr:MULTISPECIES: hypothetical protein [unclassified Bradyrhizobium]MCK1715849.1 hypothetical protein [Bradyrhizobium sp. 143]MCK1725276.1 hypothetical protein [Bradyrhizobium sp. 142]